MNRFFLRKGIFAIIAMSVLSIAFFGCFHDSDDDDDDTSSSESASDKSVGILNGAYLDGLSEIKVSAALKSGVYSDGDSVSDLFSISTNSAKSARTVSSDYVSSFGATISKISSDYFIVALSGKVALSNSSLKISVALPADKTSSGSALTVSPLTVNTGSAAAVSTASLAVEGGTAPSSSDLAGKTFKFFDTNDKTACETEYYVFNSTGTAATRIKVTNSSDSTTPEVKNYGSGTYSNGILQKAHGNADFDDMTLRTLSDGKMYLYDEDSYSTSDGSLLGKYGSDDDYFTLNSDGSISGKFQDETDEKDSSGNTIMAYGTMTGRFVNNGGVVTLFCNRIVDDNSPSLHDGSREDTFSLNSIYTGSELLFGGKFEEYFGEVPTSNN